MTPGVIAIVWSPRRIEESLASHEELGFDTAFIVGYTEHQGCEKANWIVQNHPADIYLLSYDDQVVTRQQADTVLELQSETDEVVSGWQQLGDNVPYASAVKPTFPFSRMHLLADECYYRVDELEQWPDPLIPTLFFPFALTAVPRQALLDCPIYALEARVFGTGPWFFSKDGAPYDKGERSDWTLCQDLHLAGYGMWTARDAHVKHLSPEHNIPHHRFTMDIDDPGIYWNKRPR